MDNKDKEYYNVINLNKKITNLEQLKYQKLLREQLDWLNSNYIQIKGKALKLYTFYIIVEDYQRIYKTDAVILNF